MYTNIESPRRWNSIAPCICILLVGLILFAIAATIVISLIALYLPTRDVNPSSTNSGSQQLSIPLSSDSTSITGPYDSASQANLQSQLQDGLSSNSETRNKANVQVTSATGSTTPDKKRRQSTVRATFVLVVYELIFTDRCTTTRCRSRALASAALIFVNLRPTLLGPATDDRPDQAPNKTALVNAISEKQRQSLLRDRDFVFDFQNPLPTSNDAKGRVVLASAENFPALIGHDIAMIVGTVQPCGLIQPHTHPRADELVLAVKGTFETGLLQEDGARLILNTIVAGQVVVFPQGSIHYAQNAGCEAAYFVATFNSADPGVQTTANGFYGLPTEVIASSIGGSDTSVIENIKTRLPPLPADGIQSCRQRCGLA